MTAGPAGARAPLARRPAVWFCGDWLLQGPWSLTARAVWPWWLTALRDGSVATFAGFGLYWLARAAWAEARLRLAPWRDRAGR